MYEVFLPREEWQFLERAKGELFFESSTWAAFWKLR